MFDELLIPFRRIAAVSTFCSGTLIVACLPADAQPGNRTEADRLCASYSAGFVAGDRPGHCIKVEERMRLDPHARRAMSPWEPPVVFIDRMPEPDAAMPAHLHLNGGYGATSGLH